MLHLDVRGFSIQEDLDPTKLMGGEEEHLHRLHNVPLGLQKSPVIFINERHFNKSDAKVIVNKEG